MPSFVYDHAQITDWLGAHTVATLLGELGTLQRFHSSKALVAYVGFYPMLAQSGERAAAPHSSPRPPNRPGPGERSSMRKER